MPTHLLMLNLSFFLDEVEEVEVQSAGFCYADGFSLILSKSASKHTRMCMHSVVEGMQ